MFTREFFKEGYGWLYAVGAYVTKDPDWQLTESEALDLSEKSIRVLRTLDKKKLERWEKTFGKYVPGLALVSAAAAITVPRVIGTLNKRRARRGLVQEKPRAGNTSGPATPAAPVASPSTNPTGARGEGVGASRENRTGAAGSDPEPKARLRSIGIEDSADFDLGIDEPTM